MCAELGGPGVGRVGEGETAGRSVVHGHGAVVVGGLPGIGAGPVLLQGTCRGEGSEAMSAASRVGGDRSDRKSGMHQASWRADGAGVQRVERATATHCDSTKSAHVGGMP